jgi:NADPH:quinone reductase-like Zn-dependent oxidoreductase
MRSYRLDAGTGLDGLRLDVSELPVPGPGEVLVEVRAASLSYREAMILEGRYVLPVRAGGIPLAEGVGVVSATGSGDTVLTLGTGGVSLFAVQLGKVVITVAPNHERT